MGVNDGPNALSTRSSRRGPASLQSYAPDCCVYDDLAIDFDIEVLLDGLLESDAHEAGEHDGYTQGYFKGYQGEK